MIIIFEVAFVGYVMFLSLPVMRYLRFCFMWVTIYWFLDIRVGVLSLIICTSGNILVVIIFFFTLMFEVSALVVRFFLLRFWGWFLFTAVASVNCIALSVTMFCLVSSVKNQDVILRCYLMLVPCLKLRFWIF